VLDAYYAPTIKYRTNPSDAQNDYEFYHDVALDGRYQVDPRWTLRGSERFNYTDDPSVENFGQEIRQDASFILNRLEGGVNYELSRRSYLDLLGRWRIKQYEEDVYADESDEDALAGDFTWLYQIQRDLAGVVIAGAENVDYATTLAPERGYSGYSGGVGLDKIFSPVVRGGVRAGVKSLDYEMGTAIEGYGVEVTGTETKPFASLGVQVAAQPGTRVIADARYGLRDSDVFPYAYQTETAASVKLEWDATSQLMCGLQGIYRLGQYDEIPGLSAPLAEVLAGGDETTFVALGELSYKIGQGMVTSLRQIYENVDSDVDQSFTRNTTSLTLTKQF
jgi:hypothetical protein